MAIYFNTNLPETRGLLAFDRTTSKINDILQRLDTGYRINSGKDDPTGLIKREGMRLDMKGLQSAINNSVAGQNLLTVAEKAMGSIASLLTGDPTDTQDTGIIGLLNSGSDFDKILSGMNQLASTVDSISRTTIYNGKQIINGAYDYNTLSTSSGTGKISNVKVTSANISGGIPVELAFTVTQAAERAKVQLTEVTNLIEGEEYKVMLTDGEGNSTHFAVIVDGEKKVKVDNLKSAIDTALQNYNTSLELMKSGILQSKSKGANQSITIDVTKDGASSNELDAAFKVGAADYSVPVSGKDWVFSGIAGTIVADDNKINVYSDSINFSALLSDNTVKGDAFTLNVSGGTSFQLGKDVSSAGRYNVGIATINSNNLVAKDGSTLASLRTLKEGESENEYIVRAQEAIADFATQIATERGRLGTIQKNVLVTNQYNLEDQLAIVTAEEAAISNTDVALETSRLSRQELIAESAMNVISYARSFSQFAVSSLFQ
jgi:flagellin